MALTVNTKYSGQRLDHPDFRDVAQTTFAKGVITEFQQTADDPITVLPMVKVSLAGVEFGDYLPIFFHPKALYWDGDGVLAQDYDATNKYFKQAWMSFRAGDEVVVLLQEGRPVAVLGFADGIPRIGENLIKFVVTSPSDVESYKYFLCAKDEFGDVAQIYATTEDPDGPDGLKLGVTEEIIATITQDDPVVYDVWYLAGSGGSSSMEVGYNSPDGNHWDNYYYFYKRRTTTTDYNIKFISPVGPLVYIFYFIVTHTVVVNGPLVEEYYWFNNDGVFPDHSLHDPSGYEDPSGGLSLNGNVGDGVISKTHTHPGNATMWVDSAELTVAVNTAIDSDAYVLLPDSTNKVKACQFQEDESAAVIQEDFYDEFHWFFMGLVKDQNAIKVFVRPHNGL